MILITMKAHYSIVDIIYVYKKSRKIFIYLSEGLLFLRLPLSRSDDLRAPELRGPVSEVAAGGGGVAAAAGSSTTPDDTTVLTTVDAATSFFFLAFGVGCVFEKVMTELAL